MPSVSNAINVNWKMIIITMPNPVVRLFLILVYRASIKSVTCEYSTIISYNIASRHGNKNVFRRRRGSRHRRHAARYTSDDCFNVRSSSVILYWNNLCVWIVSEKMYVCCRCTARAGRSVRSRTRRCRGRSCRVKSPRYWERSLNRRRSGRPREALPPSVSTSCPSRCEQREENGPRA